MKGSEFLIWLSVRCHVVVFLSVFNYQNKHDRKRHKFDILHLTSVREIFIERSIREDINPQLSRGVCLTYKCYYDIIKSISGSVDEFSWTLIVPRSIHHQMDLKILSKTFCLDKSWISRNDPDDPPYRIFSGSNSYWTTSFSHLTQYFNCPLYSWTLSDDPKSVVLRILVQ